MEDHTTAYENIQGLCPKCSSEDISLGVRCVEANEMTENYTCGTCQAVFAECYTLIYQFTELGGIYEPTKQ